jgi:hypothetical protein
MLFHAKSNHLAEESNAMGRLLTKVLLGFAILIAFGCGRKIDNEAQMIVPSPVNGEESWGNVAHPTSVVGYDAVVYLDYIPTSRDQVALPAGCFAPLSPDFELGYAICEGNPQSRTPIFAKNIEQRCLGDEKFLPIEPTEGFAGEECAEWTLRAYRFNPPLRFTVVRQR